VSQQEISYINIPRKVNFPKVGVKIGAFFKCKYQWKYFKILYFGNFKSTSKCIWKKVPVEIIKEICKLI